MDEQVTGSPSRPAVRPARVWASHLVVLAAYLLLTGLMTWPVAGSLTTAIPGDGFDGWQNYWNLWWVREALLVRGTNPFFTDYLYAPTGVSLLFHTLNIFNGLWTLPIQLTAGLPVAYNSVVFFSFVFAGYGGYLLSLYTITRLTRISRPGLRPAAFVGGLIFTMAPFHMAHLLGHMQVFSMVWPPFYVMWLLRTLEPWQPAAAARPIPRRRWRDAGLASLFLILASLVDWYHTLYLLLFTGLVLLWTLWLRWRRLGRLDREARAEQRRIAMEQPPLFFRAQLFPGLRFFLSHPLWQPVWLAGAIWLGFAVVLSPLLAPMVREAGSRPDLETGLAQNVTLSADLLAFVTPSELHPLWGEWARAVANRFSSTTSERLIFAGFAPMALALYGLIRYRSSLIVKFWGLVTLVFVILALGPYLHVGGQIVTIGGRTVPLPYLLLYYTIPFIDLTRSLSRYDLMVMLALGVLGAITLYRLVINKAHLTKPGSGRWLWLPYFAAGLVCFEFMAAPYPLSEIEIPPFYEDISIDPGDYTIAELPMNWDRPTPLLHQTVHGKRLLTAYTSRNNPLELAWRTPVFQHWRYLGPDIIDQPLAEIAPTIFFDFYLRYIVLDYWQMPPGPERLETERWVAAALPPQTAPVYDDGRLKVYQSPPKETTRPYLMLGQGWSRRREDASGTLTRLAAPAPESQAELVLHHPQDYELTLEIVAAAPKGAQDLTVFANGEPVDKFKVAADFDEYAVDLPPLASDMVTLRLRPEWPGQIVVSRVGLDARQQTR